MDNPFSIYKTCLGETLIATGGGSGGDTSGGSSGGAVSD